MSNFSERIAKCFSQNISTNYSRYHEEVSRLEDAVFKSPQMTDNYLYEIKYLGSDGKTYKYRYHDKNPSISITELTRITSDRAKKGLSKSGLHPKGKFLGGGVDKLIHVIRYKMGSSEKGKKIL